MNRHEHYSRNLIDKFLPWCVVYRLGTRTDRCRTGFEADTLRETPHGTAVVRPSLTEDPAAPPRRTGSPDRPTGENLAPILLVSTTMVVLYQRSQTNFSLSGSRKQTSEWHLKKKGSTLNMAHYFLLYRELVNLGRSFHTNEFLAQNSDWNYSLMDNRPIFTEILFSSTE